METMTTAEDRRNTTGCIVLRCTRAAVIALVAVLAVLVHHETVAPLTHIQPGSMVAAAETAGMDHGPAPSAPGPSDAHVPRAGATDQAAVGDDGCCSGTTMQHCSSASINTIKLAPPTQAAVDQTQAAAYPAVAGREVPGTVVRAPPDLSLLSRFLL